MISFKYCFRLTAVVTLFTLMLSNTLYAEERKLSKAEEMATAGAKEPVVNLKALGETRRSKLTEEQAVEQLKYMMVKGWVRMERILVEQGSFLPFGMTLMPDGEYKTVIVNSLVTEELTVSPEFALNAVIENLKAIAETRAVWAVGLMYIQAKEKADGTFEQRIQVLTEHIAGWARHWSYPFKVVDGEVKLGAPIETPAKPVYFSKSK